MVEEALLGLLTAFCSRCNACVHERDAVDSVSEERRINKISSDSKNTSAYGTHLMCNVSRRVCVCVSSCMALCLFSIGLKSHMKVSLRSVRLSVFFITNTTTNMLAQSLLLWVFLLILVQILHYVSSGFELWRCVHITASWL